MVDVLVLATMLVVCGGIGLPIARLLPARLAWRHVVAPTLGYGVLAVAVPVAYRAGVSITQFFYASLAVSVVVIALCMRRLLRELRDTTSTERRTIGGVAAAFIVATLAMMAPRWVGGDRFSAFQGNTWDTYAYLESAAVYARESYAHVTSATSEDVATNPMLPVAQASLVNRPSVHQLYAVFSRVAPGQTYRLHHPFLVFSLAQFVLVAMFVLRTLVPRSLLACAATAVVFPLGFWGQYVFDINAWSQIASIPTLFLIFALAVDLAAHSETNPRVAVRFGTVLAVAIAGALFLYPEGFVIYLAAAAPIAGIPTIVRSIRARQPRALIPLAGIVGVASAVAYKPTWDFLVIQLTRTSMQKVPWWDYFQIFFLGRDGDAGPTAIDGSAGFAGLYFLTPASDASPALGAASRIAIVVLLVAVIVGVVAILAGRFARDEAASDARARIVAWGVGSVLLLAPAAILFRHQNYWPAGKCVAYAAPAFVTLMCMPVLLRFPSKPLRAVRWVIVAFIAVQMATAVARVYVARVRGYYARPYPGVLDPGLKQNFPWSFRRFDRALDAHTRVLVRVPDVWPRAHVLVYLYSRGIPFAIEGPVNTYFDSGTVLAPRPPPWEPDVEFIQEQRGYILIFRDGRRPVRIVAKR